MQEPRILVSACAEEGENIPYLTALIQAGGLPIARYAPALDLSFDGLLLFGGGKEDAADGRKDSRRIVAEESLVRAYAEYGKPIFGIGYGACSINTALGGSLWQPLCAAGQAGDASHRQVRAAEGSLVWDLYDQCFFVNDVPPLAVRRAGCGITPTVWALDGAIMGFEHERLPIMGVQWHPERILQGEGGCAPGLPLFRYFICLCREGGGMLHEAMPYSPDVRFACGFMDREEEKE